MRGNLLVFYSRMCLFVSAIIYFTIFANTATAKCYGHFVNPVTDICWKCLFPITIGASEVVSAEYPDTENPSSPIQICKAKVGYRVAMALGFWEPFALADIANEPFCLVNLGGMKLKLSKHYGAGGKESEPVGTGAFYYVHWYKYPLVYWLNLLTSIGCMQTGDMDIAYLAELDPTWNNDQASLLLTPEAALFANSVAQEACAADAIAALHGLPIDKLFWCQGAAGATYPLTGHVFAQVSPVQAAILLAERVNFKLHRTGLILDSKGENHAVCTSHYSAIMPKSRYRYQLTNPIPDNQSCHPFGQSTLSWESGHLSLQAGGNFGYLIWRKRNCAFL